MITFHRDSLVPPELCWLLNQTIPEEYHLPLVFTNHRSHQVELYGQRVTQTLGSQFERHIVINLTPIYHWVTWHPVGCLSAGLWYTLLSVCYHEFGHTATHQQWAHIDMWQYNKSIRASSYVEQLASVWATRKMYELVEDDPRLAQPRHLTGYLGARLTKDMARRRSLDQGTGADYVSVKEWRCYTTGAQLSAGDVLSLTGLRSSYSPSSRYRVLRELSQGLGIDYIDCAGRKHKLYTWGDLLKLMPRVEAYERAVPSRPRPTPDPGVYPWEDTPYDNDESPVETSEQIPW